MLLQLSRMLLGHYLAERSLRDTHDTDCAVRALPEVGWLLQCHHVISVCLLLSCLGALFAANH